MKIKIDRELITEDSKTIEIETPDFCFEISIQEETGNLIINKRNGKESSSISIFPRCGNDIEIK